MDVSVVIPCYNSGAYLREALDSVVSAPVAVCFEIIIVDDGSTDEGTILLLKALEQEGFHIIRQENKGPAAARNTGVRAAKGRYILFLDSDNRIVPGYMEKGLAILDAHPDVGVVYALPRFFGSTTEPRFTPHAFHAEQLLEENYIDMCAVVRKRMWTEIGGLDETRLLIGHEDWEFWINAIIKKWKFYFIEEILFEYRILENSLITVAYNPNTFENKIKFIYRKNINLNIIRYFLDRKISIGFYLLLFKIDKKYFLNRLWNKFKIKKI